MSKRADIHREKREEEQLNSRYYVTRREILELSRKWGYSIASKRMTDVASKTSQNLLKLYDTAVMRALHSEGFDDDTIGRVYLNIKAYYAELVKLMHEGNPKRIAEFCRAYELDAKKLFGVDNLPPVIAEVTDDEGRPIIILD